MFIRRTRTRSASVGDYFTYRLVQTLREGNKVRQVTLLNLGRHFHIPKDDWKLLCARVEQITSHQKELFPVDIPEEIEVEANRIAAQLQVRRSEHVEKDSSVETDLQSVDINSLEMVRPRSVGVEQCALWAMEQLDLTDILASVGFTRPQMVAAIGSIVGRMAMAGSERATYKWLTRRSALGELIGVDFETTSQMSLYRASDHLVKNKQRIESQLFAKLQSLFGLECTVTLYDLTNTYFEGIMHGCKKARRGHSKEKRTDCPLMTLGLVLDGSGFVKRSRVLPGNVSEPSTLQDMLRDLDVPEKALVVMDRGISTSKNIEWLQKNGYRYLVVSREKRIEVAEDGSIEITTRGNSRVRIHKEISADGGEARLYCYSEQRAQKDQAITERFCRKLEQSLDDLASGLKRPRTTKKLDKIHQRIGRLLERCHGVGQHYEINVIADESGQKAVDVKWRHKPVDGGMATHPGVYCLRTNELDWNEEQLWRTYTMLTDLEAVFRSLKSELGLRPVYHHIDARCEGHMFITVLAYQFVQMIRHNLYIRGVKDSWAALRGILSTMVRVTATFQQANGKVLHVRKATKPEPEHKQIQKHLGLSRNPGGIQKCIVG